MAGNCTESGRSVTSKVTSILLAFNEGSVHTLTEIARLAGLPVSTAHRLAAELTASGLLERTDDGHYRVGLPLRMLGADWGTATAGAPGLTECGANVLEDLAAATRCRARLGVLAGLEVHYVEKQPGHRLVPAFHPAATLPAHATALGRALLAFAGPDVVRAVLALGLRAYTPHTITSADRLRRALTVTRLSRVAVTRGELELGVCGVATPVFGPGGDVVAAIELTVGDLGGNLPPALAALAVAARSLARALATDARAMRLVGPAGPVEARQA